MTQISHVSIGFGERWRNKRNGRLATAHPGRVMPEVIHYRYTDAGVHRAQRMDRTRFLACFERIAS